MALSNSDKFSKEQLIELDRLNQEAVEETNERLERIEKMDIRIDKRIKDSDDAFEEAMREQEERDETAEEEREENKKLLQLNKKVLTGVSSKVETFSKEMGNNLKDGFTEFLKSPAGIALGIVLVTFIAKNIVDPIMKFFTKTGDFLNQNYEELAYDPTGETSFGFGASNKDGKTASIPLAYRGMGSFFFEDRFTEAAMEPYGAKDGTFMKEFLRGRAEQIVGTSQLAFDFEGRPGIDDEMYERKSAKFHKNLAEMNTKVKSVNEKRRDRGLPNLSYIEATAFQRGEINESQLLNKEIVERITGMATEAKQDYLAELLIEGLQNIGAPSIIQSFVQNEDGVVTPE